MVHHLRTVQRVISDGTPISFETNSKIAHAYSPVYTRGSKALTLHIRILYLLDRASS